MKGPESGSGRAERAGSKEDRASRAYRADRGSSKSDEGSKRRLSRDDDRDGDKSPASKDTKAEKAVKDQVKDQEKSAKDEKEDAAKAAKAKSEEAIGDREKKDEAARGADKEDGKPSKSAEDTLRKDDARKDEAKLEKAKEVQLSAHKRDRVRDEFRKVTNVKRQTDVDVSISVGRRLPRHWHFYPVPIAVVDFIPEYRDYVFVYLDDEYVICDPDTYEVVAIIDAPTTTAESRGGGGGVCSTDLRLSDKTEGIILGSVRSEDEEEIDGGSLEVGWRVPDTIDLHEFDAAVTASEPGLEFCRYFVSEHQIAIVDPQRDRVVLLVEAYR
jgi:hypothetical protein